ncbi:hypothetical protein ES674_06595 [Bizionia myxarmorum]|uniref:Uncharacterized protein n=2 Tax=Bizionia myxarmorum TaxID=291186 RepID=A0A5D0RF20_9FLAO|nr:hypothetical protein ES674_06595 [Bizionia myxarmorum]
MLTDSTQVSDLSMVFPNDSIVKLKNEEAFQSANYDIEVFDKSGKLLLILSPKKMLDSTSLISTIKIEDARFKTKKGISINSTFGDIQKNYKISSIHNTLKNAVIFVNEINAFFTIDKKELPASLQFDTDTEIEAIQIPETAKIKYFMIGWN